MNPEAKYYVEIFKEGKPLRLDAVYNALSNLSPGRFVITIAKYTKKRSNNQNSFYWAHFIQSQIECFQEMWGETYSKEAVHAWNKTNFWGEEKVTPQGEIIRSPGSSSDKNTVEFEEKLEVIRQWFRQNFEWELVYPNEQTEMF